MPIDKSKITKEMLDKAAQCETAEQLIALAKTAGFEITRSEAEAYLAELENCELDAADLDKVAGGDARACWGVDNCPMRV
ncbi:MAG: Nif11 family protein [Spirochaetia bacterium]|nr:Nif11 family protein [Spirochaetia bacterium]